MTRTHETSLSLGQGPDADGIAGISTEEFHAMRSAAIGFLGSDGDTDTSAVNSSLEDLLQGAAADAAGKVSARRATYDKVAGAHWCVMAHLPHVER